MLRSFERDLFATVLIFSTACQHRTVSPPGHPEPTPRTIEWRTAIEETFRVDVRVHGALDVTSRLGQGAHATDPDSQQVARYGPFLQRELARYPPDAFNCAGIQSIVLATRLVVSGHRRAAAPDYQGHALVLDPEPESAHEQYWARVVHHEFYHSLEYADSARDRWREAWRRSNSTSFAYGPGGIVAYINPGNYAGLRQPSDGFITLYATTGIEEDRAEVFSTVMVMPSEVYSLARSDSILQRKIELLRANLSESCPSLAASLPPVPNG
jgi:hypothetical protein